MGRNGVKVIIRTRPTANFATHQLQINPDDGTITVYSGAAALAAASGGFSPPKTDAGPSNRKECWQFKFHQILHNACQDRVYEAIARDIVYSAVIEGTNGTILAYGQTGAGKSFTMIGDTHNYQYRGIAPRAIAQLFQEIENRIELQFTVRVSYMEIYNDRIYNLLETQASDPVRGNSGDLVVVEDTHGTNVRGLTQVEVHSEQEALDQLFYGELQRTVAEHQLNKRSNRSHCILTFHIAQKSRVGGTERVTLSKLHLVDLAGSERLKKTIDEESKSLKNRKADLSSTIRKESMYINQSLSFLEQCIVALGSRDSRHIPYRQTKLTNVLKDSLGGNSNTLMFACICGEKRHLEETISTLKLAQRMMRVQNEVATIVETDPILLVRKYERQIRELKHELIMHDALVERSAIVYDEHTPEQKRALQQMVRRYIDAPTQTIEDEILRLTSVHEIRELFRQFKLLVKSSGLELKDPEAELTGLADTTPSSTFLTSGSEGSLRAKKMTGSCNNLDVQATLNHSDGELVGEEEPGAVGFSFGLVPGSARPSSIDFGKTTMYRKAEEVGAESKKLLKSLISTDKEFSRVSTTLRDDCKGKDREDYSNPRQTDETPNFEIGAKNNAFQHFRTIGHGRDLWQSLQSDKDKLLDAKQIVKQLTRRVNGSKAQIDTVRAQLDEKRKERGGEDGRAQKLTNGGRKDLEEVVDEEEFILMTAEREAKREYRSLFGELKDAKAELDFARRSVELARRRLVREFEDWFDQEGQLYGWSKSSNEELIRFKEDKLDDGEKFDQMEEERTRAQDPDSLAFFQAQKKMRQQSNLRKPKR